MTRFLATFASVLPVALLALLAGCIDSGPGAKVQGEVTLDGKPLRKGTIRFVPPDGQSTTSEAQIIDGKYSVAVSPGEWIIEITAPKVSKIKKYDTPDSPEVEKIDELLPQRYNVRSELRMTVQRGKQEKKFELKSK